MIVALRVRMAATDRTICMVPAEILRHRAGRVVMEISRATTKTNSVGFLQHYAHCLSTVLKMA